MAGMVDHDWEYSESDCPKCYNQMACRSCNECGGEGWVEDDEDDEWADSGQCDNCQGLGFEEWCRECGWDETFGRFMSPQYERANEERRLAIAQQQSTDLNHGD